MVRQRSNSAPQRKSWISINRISPYRDMEIVLGKGTFSTVYLYYDIVENRKIAVKIIDQKKIPSKFYINEINLLSTFDHYSIVKYYGTSLIKDMIAIMLEYIPGINFFEYVSKSKPIKERYIRDLFLMIFEAVDYIHDLNIVHRDIKLENMVYNYKDREIKLIDFGFACCDDGTHNDRPGSLQYSSPDIFFIKKIITWKPIDIWCLGVALYITITLEYPYWDNVTTDFTVDIFDIDPSYSVKSDISKECIHLTKSMLNTDHYDRLTIKEIINSKWININL